MHWGAGSYGDGEGDGGFVFPLEQRRASVSAFCPVPSIPRPPLRGVCIVRVSGRVDHTGLVAFVWWKSGEGGGSSSGSSIGSGNDVTVVEASRVPLEERRPNTIMCSWWCVRYDVAVRIVWVPI